MDTSRIGGRQVQRGHSSATPTLARNTIPTTEAGRKNLIELEKQIQTFQKKRLPGLHQLRCAEPVDLGSILACRTGLNRQRDSILKPHHPSEGGEKSVRTLVDDLKAGHVSRQKSKNDADRNIDFLKDNEGYVFQGSRKAQHRQELNAKKVIETAEADLEKLKEMKKSTVCELKIPKKNVQELFNARKALAVDKKSLIDVGTLLAAFEEVGAVDDEFIYLRGASSTARRGAEKIEGDDGLAKHPLIKELYKTLQQPGKKGEKKEDNHKAGRCAETNALDLMAAVAGVKSFNELSIFCNKSQVETYHLDKEVDDTGNKLKDDRSPSTDEQLGGKHACRTDELVLSILNIAHNRRISEGTRNRETIWSESK